MVDVMSGTAERLRIWQHNAEHALREAGGLTSPGDVLVVCSAEDPVGLRLAQAVCRAAGRLEELEADRARTLAAGQIPTVYVVAPREKIAEFLAGSSPSVAGKLRGRFPEGCLPVVVIAAGGALLLGVERPARAPGPVVSA